MNCFFKIAGIGICLNTIYMAVVDKEWIKMLFYGQRMYFRLGKCRSCIIFQYFCVFVESILDNQDINGEI